MKIQPRTCPTLLLHTAVAYVVLAFAPGTRAELSAQDIRPMTVEDVLRLKSVRDPQISPDGRRIAYVISELDLEDDVIDSDIWLVSADEGEPVRLTRGAERDNTPRWAPDGSWIAFLSDRQGRTQVFGIDPDGGEAWRVTDWATAINAFEIAPDGDSIAFIASPEESEADKDLEKLRGRPIVWDSAYATSWSRLWVAPLLKDMSAGEAVQSSPDSQYVQGVAWSPDSTGVAWSARPSPVLRTWRFADVFVRDAAETLRRVTSMPGGESIVEWTELGLIVSATGQALGTYNSQLWRVPASGGDPVSLTAALDENADFVAVTERDLLLEARHRTGRRLYRIDLANGAAVGQPRVLSDDRLFYHSFTASHDGRRVAFIAEGPNTPPDVHVSSTGDFRPYQRTEVNPQVRDYALGEQRVVRWTSAADEEPIEGVLTLPVGYREGDRVPLLLVIHGGPAGVSSDRFTPARGAYPIQVLAGLGYAILQPNYRGSTGYGQRFRGLNRGDISGRDWIDIDSGVDYLIDTGIADPERLGIMGWSFGGHLTYWGITQTDRFGAASAGAGANDLISMYSQTDIPEFYHTYLGPKPWEDFDFYEQRSAYRNVERVTTPLLIQVGERDERVPAEQSIQFYEAMRSIGKAPVKLVIYPGEPHGIRSPRHRRDLMARNVEWFVRWIPPEEEVTRR